MTAGAYDYLRLKSDVLIEWGIEAKHALRIFWRRSAQSNVLNSTLDR